jgi:hypothetical protein
MYRMQKNTMFVPESCVMLNCVEVLFRIKGSNSKCKNWYSSSPSYEATPTKSHPFYQARFQMHSNWKMLVSCAPQEKPPLLSLRRDHFYIAEDVAL